MAISSDSSIDNRIVEMRKDKWGLFRIHKWVTKWDNFSNLDEQIVLAHILNILNREKLNVTKNEIRYCFLQYYKRDFHGDKDSYLKWLYGLVTNKKTKHRVVLGAKELFSPLKLKKTSTSKGKPLMEVRS